MQPLYSWD